MRCAITMMLTIARRSSLTCGLTSKCQCPHCGTGRPDPQTPAAGDFKSARGARFSSILSPAGPRDTAYTCVEALVPCRGVTSSMLLFWGQRRGTTSSPPEPNNLIVEPLIFLSAAAYPEIAARYMLADDDVAVLSVSSQQAHS